MAVVRRKRKGLEEMPPELPTKTNTPSRLEEVIQALQTMEENVRGAVETAKTIHPGEAIQDVLGGLERLMELRGSIIMESEWRPAGMACIQCNRFLGDPPQGVATDEGLICVHCDRAGPKSTRVVYLVACVKTKRFERMAAKNLYCSEWFVKARLYVEAKIEAFPETTQWRILSAQHGLLDPDKTISPYSLSVQDMNANERIAWSQGVLDSLMKTYPKDRHHSIRFVFLAGKKYRELLMKYLVREGHFVSEPIASMGIGEQMAWFKNERRLTLAHRMRRGLHKGVR